MATIADMLGIKADVIRRESGAPAPIPTGCVQAIRRVHQAAVRDPQSTR